MSVEDRHVSSKETCVKNSSFLGKGEKCIKSSKNGSKTEVIKVGPVRVQKSDITFDFMASSQLREEASKIESCILSVHYVRGQLRVKIHSWGRGH